MTAEKIEEQIIRIKQQVTRLEQQVGDAKRNRDSLTQKHVDEKRSIAAQTQYLRQLLENISILGRKLSALPQESQAQRASITLEKQLAEQQYKSAEKTTLQPLHEDYALTGDKLIEAKSKYEELAHELAREKTVLEQKNHEATEHLVNEPEKIPSEREQLARAQEKNRQTAQQHVQANKVQKTTDQIKPLPPYAN